MGPPSVSVVDPSVPTSPAPYNFGWPLQGPRKRAARPRPPGRAARRTGDSAPGGGAPPWDGELEGEAAARAPEAAPVSRRPLSGARARRGIASLESRRTSLSARRLPSCLSSPEATSLTLVPPGRRAVRGGQGDLGGALRGEVWPLARVRGGRGLRLLALSRPEPWLRPGPLALPLSSRPNPLAPCRHGAPGESVSTSAS